MKTIARIIALLSAVGVANGSYLTYLFIQKQYFPASITVCDINDTLSCSKILTSPYSKFLGLPICSIAIVVYITIVVLALLAAHKARPQNYFFTIALLTAAATAFNIVYIHNEYVFLKALCIFCVFCTGLVITNLVLSIIGYLKSAR